MKGSGKKLFGLTGLIVVTTFLITGCESTVHERKVVDFNDNWYFSLNDSITDLQGARKLSVPHDWSIEGSFSPDHPAGVGGGALPGGTGWYRKEFTLDQSAAGKKAFIQFDGVYQNSTVWINGQLLGQRPNGYISFEYDLTPYLYSGDSVNVLAVRVDNSQQPNSRWYSGSGIYRDVRLVITDEVFIPQYGTYVTTPEIAESAAQVAVQTQIKNESGSVQSITLITSIINTENEKVGEQTKTQSIAPGEQIEVTQELTVQNPVLWTLENPELYTVVSSLKRDGKQVDRYETPFGIRAFTFDVEKGFSLNGKSAKIKGVCLHHDLGCLGAAFNLRAMKRQLEIMKAMGANAIRTSHNPPAPGLLDLCDRMGLLVMDEMFDMWKKQKSKYDYGMYWDEWHEQDLRDFIRRDRNHPSIIVWSVGNEIQEQYDHTDTAGGMIARELAGIVRELDITRPVTTANNDTSPDNPLIRYGDLDLVGFNYHHEEYAQFPEKFPGRKFIATETNSELSTRGHYDMPSDSVRIWPLAWDKPFELGNPDNTVSAYDHVTPPWGSTHEDTWRIVKKHDFISGMFIWTGFDYLGEPTPYTWPSRSSYFGLVDLAGFTKDTYYMYKSEWSEDTVLHIFPHWNLPAGRKEGDEVDVWAYYNHADEVELFLNDESLGVKKKPKGQFHVMWRVAYQPGTLRAVSRKDGEEVLTREIRTAGKPARLALEADRSRIVADGIDLSFVTVKVLDKEGNMVPYADDLITFQVEGAGEIAGVDNGDPTSHELFQEPDRKAFNGKCLVVIQSTSEPGELTLTGVAKGLESGSVKIITEQDNSEGYSEYSEARK